MRSMGKRLFVTALVAALITGVLSGCGASVAKAESTTELNIAIQPVVGFLPLYVMKDTGSLEKALKDNHYDIKINYVEFESGPPENEAFASKQVDVGVMGNVPAISGIANGQERAIIGIAYNGEETEAVIVKNESDITAVEQLRGKKIGLVIGSIAQNYLSVLLENNGLSLSDVELINLSTGEQQQALQTGMVDAVATWEPTLSKLTANGDNRILADGTEIFLGENPIVARSEYVKANPEIVRIFLEEYEKAAQLIEDDIPGYASKYADKFLLDKEIVELALTHAKLQISITEEDIKDLQNTADFLYREKLITREVNIKDYVNIE